jgi:hypothetical protein
MAKLTCKSNGGKLITEHAWLYSGKIEDVGILNGVTPEGWKQPIEIGVRLFLEKGTLTFQPEIMIFGQVKRNTDSTVADWGAAFPVRDLLFHVGGYDGPIGEDLDIPLSALKRLLGKTVYYVRYRSTAAKADGTKHVFTYKEVAATEAAMVERWKRQVVKGYPKDYLRSATAVAAVATEAPTF